MSYYSEISLKSKKKMLYIYMGFLIILSLSIIAMPFINNVKETIRLLLVMDGLFFWIGIIGTILISFKIDRYRKRSSKFAKFYPDQKQLGIIHFFRNKEAIIVDILMFVSLTSFIIVKLITKHLVPAFILLGVFVFTFGMHCMLNGINYIYINYGMRRK